jgi:hypothetical protein
MSQYDRPSPASPAKSFVEGTRKKGKDHNMWEVVVMKNGIKRWKKRKEAKKEGKKRITRKLEAVELYNMNTIRPKELKRVIEQSPREIRDTLHRIEGLIDDLQNMDKIAVLVPLPRNENGDYWGDYAPAYLRFIYGDDSWMEHPQGFIYFTVYMNTAGNQINKEDLIRATYSPLDKKEKIDLIRLLEKHLPNQFLWNGNNMQVITIPFQRQKTKKINIFSLKSEDEYPKIEVDIKLSERSDLFSDRTAIDSIRTRMNLIFHLTKSDHELILNEYGLRHFRLISYGLDRGIYRQYIGSAVSCLQDLIQQKLIADYTIIYYEHTNGPYDRITSRKMAP